jgi:hypothetical protein
MMDDDFDIEKFRVEPGQIPQPQSKKAYVKRKRACFVIVPCTWWHLLARAQHIVTYRVALHLLDQSWRTGEPAVPLSNCCLEGEGVSPASKNRALIELQELGLIRVKRQWRKSPLVRLLLLE